MQKNEGAYVFVQTADYNYRKSVVSGQIILLNELRDILSGSTLNAFDVKVSARRRKLAKMGLIILSAKNFENPIVTQLGLLSLEKNKILEHPSISSGTSTGNHKTVSIERSYAMYSLRNITSHIKAKELIESHVLPRFNQYLNRTSTKSILIQNINTGKYKLLKHTHRFNEGRRNQYGSDIQGGMQSLASRCKKGVMLTLTTDPKLFSNLYDAAKHMSKAWNRFIAWLRKTYPGITYLKRFEFSPTSQLPHLHVIIPLGWIAPIKRISHEWLMCGQGKIVHIYSLLSDGCSFRWGKARPSDAGANTDPSNYVSKYIRKVGNELQDSLYFTTNTRFYTMSNNLIYTQKPKKGPVQWQYIGSVDYILGQYYINQTISAEFNQFIFNRPLETTIPPPPN